MGKKVCLLIVDPQVDFCDPAGSLPVKGADKDMERQAAMIHRAKDDIDEICCTMDQHRAIHIAHPIFWCDKNGKHPNPFTLIEVPDVTGSDPKWRSTNLAYKERAIEYVQKLKANGRYVLCIWPPHCLIASVGATVHPVLFKAFQEWEQRFAVVNYVTKGSNPFTEHYSAAQADVFDPEDPSTGLNTEFIKLLQTMDVIAIGGEASSHCVASTIKDVADNFGEDNVKKFVYLKDACSPVTGFEDKEKAFLDEMTRRGMKVSTTDKFLR